MLKDKNGLSSVVTGLVHLAEVLEVLRQLLAAALGIPRMTIDFNCFDAEEERLGQSFYTTVGSPTNGNSISSKLSCEWRLDGFACIF